VVTAARQLFRGDRLLLPLVVVMWSFVYGFVYVGDGRYHFPLVPLFCLFAAFFVWWLLAAQPERVQGQGKQRARSRPPK
jgi:hypothetical protein